MKTLNLYSFAITVAILFSSYMLVLVAMIMILHK